MNNEAKQARPRADVLSEILDPNVAKNEHGWVAADEIERLQDKLEAAQDNWGREVAELGEQIERLQKALRSLRNEAAGIAGLPELREVVGNTNLACLELRIKEAEELLPTKVSHDMADNHSPSGKDTLLGMPVTVLPGGAENEVTFMQDGKVVGRIVGLDDETGKDTEPSYKVYQCAFCGRCERGREAADAHACEGLLAYRKAVLEKD